MQNDEYFYSALKRDSPLSVGTRGESRGATQVKRVASKKIPCVSTGKISQRHFSGTSLYQWLYPCPITGASRIGILVLRLHSARSSFHSEVHSTSALLPCFHHDSARLSENRFEAYSSSSAFYVWYWAVFYDGGRDVSRMKI